MFSDELLKTLAEDGSRSNGPPVIQACDFISSYLRSFFAAGGASVGLLVLTRNFSIFVMFSLKFRQYVTVCVAMLRDVSGANQSGLRHDL